MDYQQKQVLLKNGQSAVFRAPNEKDGQAMLDYLKEICAETDFLASFPEEIHFTAEDESKYLQDILDSPNRLMIVCTVDGELAGNCQIVFMTSMKTKHRAAVMIGLRKKFWNLGIGSAMFSELIEIAKAKGIAQLELEVFEHNRRAMALYRKMGFEVMATHPDAFRLRDGSSQAAVFMRKVL